MRALQKKLVFRHAPRQNDLLCRIGRCARARARTCVLMQACVRVRVRGEHSMRTHACLHAHTSWMCHVAWLRVLDDLQNRWHVPVGIMSASAQADANSYTPRRRAHIFMHVYVRAHAHSFACQSCLACACMRKHEHIMHCCAYPKSVPRCMHG